MLYMLLFRIDVPIVINDMITRFLFYGNKVTVKFTRLELSPDCTEGNKFNENRFKIFPLFIKSTQKKNDVLYPWKNQEELTSSITGIIMGRLMPFSVTSDSRNTFYKLEKPTELMPKSINLRICHFKRGMTI